MTPYPFHSKSTAALRGSAPTAFAWLDDHRNIASHMARRRSAVGGGQMQLETDAQAGHAVGSRLKLEGRALGIALSVETRVVEREPPFRKLWETVSEPRLLVIGRYRMGFELMDDHPALRLRVFIDYNLPESPAARLVGRMFAPAYARWCTAQIVRDAVKHLDRLPQ